MTEDVKILGWATEDSPDGARARKNVQQRKNARRKMASTTKYFRADMTLSWLATLEELSLLERLLWWKCKRPKHGQTQCCWAIPT